MRTPLNAILGFSQFLSRQTANGIQSECLGHITKAGSHLLGLINEVLDISRIESGHVEMTPVPVYVGPVMRETFALVRALAEERRVRLRLERPARAARLRVLADPQRLRQILLNLLSNAVKYNAEGGSVTVACSVAEDAGDRVDIAVTDTGAGIPADKLGRLFVAFDRLGAENSDVPGTGLGLVLSRCLAEAQGGGIQVESTPGHGSTFHLRLPAAGASTRRAVVPRLKTPAPAPPAVPATDAEPVFTSRHRVLYIEDNDSNLCLLERLLEDFPQITLLKATCGTDGLEIILRDPPDLLLLDLHLPDLMGEEILTRLRHDEQTRRLPVLVMSADATAASINRLNALGADAYLTKPLDLPTMLSTMQRFLEPPSPAPMHGRSAAPRGTPP